MMKHLCLDQDDINLIVKALRYAIECGYEGNLSPEVEEEYDEVCALIERLTPKPVQKEGWMVKWDSGAKSSVYETEKAARDRYGYPKVCNGKIVKVTWEE